MSVKTKRPKGGDGRKAVILRDLKMNRDAYLLIIPVVLFYLLFAYKPMYGMLIAFKNYSPARGILGSEWAASFGMEHFISFFGSYYFLRILRNTVIISLTSILFGFPAPILLALLLNEIKSERFKRLTQTISYMPHFISLVVVCSMINMFTSNTGFLTALMPLFGQERVSLLSQQQYFVPIYVLSGIWQEIGWGAIIYLAALTGIDQELYEAARIDGAGRWKQTLYVTLPGISSTIIIMLLLRLGSVMNVGFEKIILLYNPSIYETADVISSFVYRKGLNEFQWSYSAAVGLFNSVVNFVLIILFNRLSRKASEVSLW
ncbi:MAG: sugar ABC transporter permease [Provencibacterium sp.]|jgi:putative aldouronate transport system permease protein|nr:sugar ABC transporter permease [Provencibacterium sp.]